MIDSDATGSQHYMNCMQLDVQSDGTDFPANEYMVAFPGAYKKDDPGIKIDIWWPLPLAEDYQVSHQSHFVSNVAPSLTVF